MKHLKKFESKTKKDKNPKIEEKDIDELMYPYISKFDEAVQDTEGHVSSSHQDGVGTYEYAKDFINFYQKKADKIVSSFNKAKEELKKHYPKKYHFHIFYILF